MTQEARQAAFDCRGTVDQPSSQQSHPPRLPHEDAQCSVQPSASPQCPGVALVMHIDLQVLPHGVPKDVGVEQEDPYHVNAWPC